LIKVLYSLLYDVSPKNLQQVVFAYFGPYIWITNLYSRTFHTDT